MSGSHSWDLEASASGADAHSKLQQTHLQVNDPRHPPAQTKADLRDGGFCHVNDKTGENGIVSCKHVVFEYM